MTNRNDRRKACATPYDKMTDEALRQILRTDAENPEGDVTDIEQLLCVMEVLARRRQERNEEQNPKEAFRTFKKYYLSNEIPKQKSAKLSVTRKNHWKRSLVAAVAAVVLLVGSMATAKAFGIDIYSVIAKWTEETFFLNVEKEPDRSGELNKIPESDYADLQEALTDYGITAKLVPTWIPEGYELREVKVRINNDRRWFFGGYTKDKNMISIEIQDCLVESPLQMQQSVNIADIYAHEGVTYYIVSNMEQLQAAWLTEGFACRISGPVTVEEMKKMIDSIAKG